MTDGEYQAYQDRVEEALELLREHFSTALIITSLYEGETRVTQVWTNDIGDRYSIERQVQKWLEDSDQDVQMVFEMEDDEGDDYSNNEPA